MVPKNKEKAKEFHLARVEEHILLVLNRDGRKDKYGYQIMQEIEVLSDGRYKLGYGSLYPALTRLEDKGFVNSKWGEEKLEELGGARRRYYKITPDGVQALENLELLRTWLGGGQLA
ncbi:PadR family transcriptional regulator [Gloeobacter morelensis]|uniref:Helix-turn-helix transcriptional regulator n=1 Tax=Gloeobacter morelensis MG652769 TaxID=2781736 RepID=A0ABY3PJE5_9CYAN|nr:PadR family transcriptional regulator [Gloeobacter morelensis]UFP93811.1 helix-turn-helix transcriptional regulator [Gloeobacter morelensis MG652769]